jgi:hypothetical protein
MFGDYRPEALINQSIWLGQKVDSVGEPASGEAPVCIKVVNTPERGDRDLQPAQHLLMSAAVQHAIAQHSIRWAPVLQLGSDGIDSYYVTHRFPRSLRTLIADRVELGPEQLRRVMLEIVEALIDLDHTYNLAHGNLKPSNVFLTSENEITDCCVRLSDPDGTDDADPAVTRLYDVQSLGEMLYTLVTFDQPEDGLEHPLTDLSPWKHLGSSAKKLFELCNQMLDAPAHPEIPWLGHLREQLSTMKLPHGRGFMASLFL